jgi:transposase InsO family protein
MENNSRDDTLKKNYIQKYQFLIKAYEQVKAKKHPQYTKVKDFYAAHGTCPQTFLKYYARYKQSDGNTESLMPKKRGPVYKTRRTPKEIEGLVLQVREKGCNKYDIHSILLNTLQERTPSPSCIYKILKRYGKNKLTEPIREEKRRIIKEKAGELAHIDCHYLSKDTIQGSTKRYYLVAIIDSCTRIAWVEVISDIKAISVMFATLHMFSYIREHYGIKFQEVLTDNGPEFGPKQSKRKDEHPFERLLIEMDIKHRYTRPYRPQTNGKVERLWRTLNEDLINGTYFESIEHFNTELMQYLVYYNEMRSHQALNGKTPKVFLESHQRIT